MQIDQLQVPNILQSPPDVDRVLGKLVESLIVDFILESKWLDVFEDELVELLANEPMCQLHFGILEYLLQQYGW